MNKIVKTILIVAIIVIGIITCNKSFGAAFSLPTGDIVTAYNGGYMYTSMSRVIAPGSSFNFSPIGFYNKFIFCSEVDQSMEGVWTYNVKFKWEVSSSGVTKYSADGSSWKKVEEKTEDKYIMYAQRLGYLFSYINEDTYNGQKIDHDTMYNGSMFSPRNERYKSCFMGIS